MSKAIPPLPNTSSWGAAYLSTGTTFNYDVENGKGKVIPVLN